MLDIALTEELLIGVAPAAQGGLEITDRGLRPHRLPAAILERFPDPQLSAMEAQPSGVRLDLVTAADRLELDVHPMRMDYLGAPRPRGAIDVVLDGELLVSEPLTGGDALEIDLMTGSVTPRPGPSHPLAVDLPAGEHRVQVWLPHNESLELLGLRAEAPVRPAPRPGARWLHYGSSISQGSNAATPTGIWPVITARGAGADLRNLGFGGSCLLDPFIARHLRETSADAISLEIGINIVNSDAMRRRTLVPAMHGFLDTIREGHPETPIVLITPFHCGIHERTAGPGAFDPSSFGTGQIRFLATGEEGDTALGRLTLEVIREALAEVVAARGEDAHLHLVDGLTAFGAADEQELPLADNLHPGPEAHQRIGGRLLGGALGEVLRRAA